MTGRASGLKKLGVEEREKRRRFICDYYSHSTNVNNHISNITTHDCDKWQRFGENGIPEAAVTAFVCWW